MAVPKSTSAFRTIYDGFEHGGLRTQLDEHDEAVFFRNAGRAGGAIVRLASGERVGEFNRYIAEVDRKLIVRHESIKLDPSARGGGFARALQSHAERRYREMGVCEIRLLAEHVGSILWARLGFDFLLQHAPGETEDERRASVISDLFGRNTRPVSSDERETILYRHRDGTEFTREEPVRLPRPIEVLERAESSADTTLREAGEMFRARLPGGHAEPFATPLDLVDFDQGSTRLGERIMLGSAWQGVKRLD